MTRTEKLSNEIGRIVAENKSEIDNIEHHGPDGGTNAANIPGWSHTGNGTITRAANMAGCPTKNYWSGSNPTPATSIPTCILKETESEYKKIFHCQR